MLMHIVVGLACLIIGWILRPVYTKWQRLRGFRWVASTVTTFDRGRRMIEEFSVSSRFVSNPKAEFSSALVPNLIKFAETQEDLDWILKNCSFNSFSGSQQNPEELFAEWASKRDQIREQKPKESTCITCGTVYPSTERVCPRDGTTLDGFRPKTRMAPASK
jgi:hypothetical protein